MPRPITVVEVDPFPRRAAAVWTDDERLAFIDHIARHPLAGDEIPDTGGVRKLRWSRLGMGKRGGVRVIYFFYNEGAPIYLITVYAKSVREDLTPQEKQMARRFAEAIKAQYRGRTSR